MLAGVTNGRAVGTLGSGGNGVGLGGLTLVF
jgi:hypothetical protein